jgi:glycosyltransferase involved in cell wall biosynthesis
MSSPKISIVTPSFNQGEYIEETIQSVISQNYPNFEFIIIDGGSTDNSVKIIRKYEKWISYWTSELDKGQSHAINKGFSKAKGDIFGYINSDDIYEQGAFAAIAEIFSESKQTRLVAGKCMIFGESEKERIFEPWWPDNLLYLLNPFGSPFAQPASFWRKDLYYQVSGFDEALHYAFDREFFLKIGLLGVRPRFVNRVTACYRDHSQTKTRNTIKFYEESIPIIKKYGHKCGLSDIDIWLRLLSFKNDIEYLRIFRVWRNKGRQAALLRFIRWAALSPTFLKNRKVLGQARRLLMFREKDVAEIKRS